MKTLKELIVAQEVNNSVEQNTVASCAEFASSWIPRYVLAVQGLDVHNQIVTEPQLVSSFPIAGGFSTLVFLDDGYIHYGEYGATSDENAWFVLKAHCTVIDK